MKLLLQCILLLTIAISQYAYGETKPYRQEAPKRVYYSPEKEKQIIDDAKKVCARMTDYDISTLTPLIFSVPKSPLPHPVIGDREDRDVVFARPPARSISLCRIQPSHGRGHFPPYDSRQHHSRCPRQGGCQERRPLLPAGRTCTRHRTRQPHCGDTGSKRHHIPHMALDVRLALCYEVIMQNPQGAFTNSAGQNVPPGKAEDKLEKMAQSLGGLIDRENDLIKGALESLGRKKKA